MQAPYSLEGVTGASVDGRLIGRGMDWAFTRGVSRGLTPRHRPGGYVYSTAAQTAPASQDTSHLVELTREVIMKTDADIRRDVESELRWDPGINDTRIEDIHVKISL